MSICPETARIWGSLKALLFAVVGYGLTTVPHSPVEAKTPGQTYCFHGTCHRVKSLAETEALVGAAETVEASFYDHCSRDSYNPCGLTSSGEAFRPDAADNAASPVYPDGTKLLVWSPVSREAVVVRINNAGPYWGKRMLDLSRAAAIKLGFIGQGVSKVVVRVIDAPDKAEATYKRNRTYDPVAGYIGQFTSLDEAQNSAPVVQMIASATTPGGSTQSQPAPVRVAAVAEAPPAVAVAQATDTASKDAEPTAVAQPVKAEVVAVADTEPSRPARVANVVRRAKVVRTASASSRAARRAKAVVVASANTAAIKARAQRMPEGPNDISLFSRYSFHAATHLADASGPARSAAKPVRVAMR